MTKNENARALGSLGGNARAKSLTPEQRKAIAQKGGLQAKANRNAKSNPEKTT